MLGIADSVAGRDIFQAYCCADVARQDFLNVFALIGVHLQQAANALISLGARVQDRITRFQDSGVDAYKRQLSHVRISHNLECQRRKWLVVGSFAGNGLGRLGIDSVGLRNVERRRKIINNRVKQRLHAFILKCSSNHDREHL